MMLLIILPFAIAALMWSILPSGYRSLQCRQEREILVSGEWHPLQPAVHQAIDFIKP